MTIEPRSDKHVHAPSAAEPGPQAAPQHHAGHGRGHSLMMLACCVPMLLVVIALVVSGAAGSGAILFALLCVAMMAAMMFALPGGHKH